MNFPLRLDDPQGFRGLRRLLAESDFSEEGVCRRREIPSIYDFRTLREREGDGEESPRPDSPPVDALDLLVHLFMDGEGVPRETLEGVLDRDGWRPLETLGLITAHPVREAEVAATALLYPTAGLHIASDLNEDAPGASPDGGRLRPDSVYPAITDAAREFMADLPREGAGDRVLDLCAGTGVAALACASSAEHVWAVDITERCTRFAEFNARLNGIENATALEGDLYLPVAGQTFHRIVAHPPYVPSGSDEYIFRDGGEDGEQIFRRIVEGLPDHLLPGGLFYARCMATDRRNAPLEDRLRSLLGQASSEFHIFVVPSRVMDPARYILGALQGGRMGPEEADRRLTRLQEGGVEAFVHGTILIQRRAEPGTVATVRRRRGGELNRVHLDWLRRWTARSVETDLDQWLMEQRPSLRDGAQVEVIHRVVGGQPQAESLRVQASEPFPTAIALPPQAANFLPLFDGERTSREVHALAAERGWIPEGTTEGEWAGLLRSLVGGGVLCLDEEIEKLDPVVD